MLTIQELRKAVEIMKTVQQVTQELAGEIDEKSQYLIIQELRSLANIISELVELLDAAEIIQVKVDEAKLLAKNID